MDLSVLLPSVGKMFSGDLEGASALFWSFIYIAFIIFINLFFVDYVRIRSKLNRFQLMLSQLKSYTAPLLEKTSDFRHTLAPNLIEVFDALDSHVERWPIFSRNIRGLITTPIGQWIRHELIGEERQRLMSKKFLPGLLVGMGLLGTFIGIQLGIGGVDISGDADQMKMSVQNVLQGASIAFMTSIWGVVFSLIASAVINKFIFKLEERCRQLELEIDRIFEEKTDKYLMEMMVKQIEYLRQDLAVKLTKPALGRDNAREGLRSVVP